VLGSVIGLGLVFRFSDAQRHYGSVVHHCVLYGPARYGPALCTARMYRAYFCLPCIHVWLVTHTDHTDKALSYMESLQNVQGQQGHTRQ